MGRLRTSQSRSWPARPITTQNRRSAWALTRRSRAYSPRRFWVGSGRLQWLALATNITTAIQKAGQKAERRAAARGGGVTGPGGAGVPPGQRTFPVRARAAGRSEKPMREIACSVEKPGQARVAQGRELVLAVAVVDHVHLGVDVARVHRELVEAARELAAQDRGQGLVAHLRGVGHSVLPLPVEAALEHDRRAVAQRQAVLAGQLAEEGPAAAVAVHVLVRVEVGGQAPHLLAEQVELPPQLGPAGQGVVELHQALGLVREVDVQAHREPGPVAGEARSRRRWRGRSPSGWRR